MSAIVDPATYRELAARAGLEVPEEPKANKYRAQKCDATCERRGKLAGKPHDSLRECRRWRELVLLERAGEIRRLEEQVEYVLFEARPSLRSTRMVLDFRYERLCQHGPNAFKWDVVLEDAKGRATRDWTTKRKWLKQRFGLDVVTV